MQRKPFTVVGVLAAALMASQIALMAVPATIVELTRAWSLDAAQMGWLGGIYFAGYALGLPFLAGMAGRIDGRLVYALSAGIAAAAAFGFAVLAQGFWLGLALRFVGGIGFAGIHIVGMKLMADRLTGAAQARAGALYSAAYAVGSGASFLIAGPVASALGWPAAFVTAGIGSLAAIPLVCAIGAPLPGHEVRSRRWLPDFRGAFVTPATVRYVIAYAGNTWEVFAMRIWFVPLLAFNADLHASAAHGLNLSVLAGVSAIASVPVSIVVAELGIRCGRERVVRAVSLASVAVAVALGTFASAGFVLVLALLMLHGATSYGDAGAINGGLMASSRPETRSAALALFGLFGFTAGFLGPLAVGLMLHVSGGTSSPTAWFAAFLVVGFGSVVSAAAMGRLRRPA
ncbi:MAG: MFS transporter [Burkholderiales bacterium]|nr:MFS transporter [Burkholderiales bacterium]